jgi:hypothetical protein
MLSTNSSRIEAGTWRIDNENEERDEYGESARGRKDESE